MFYSQVILTRKGPLGKIWLAAHYEKKLTKSQVFTTDISDSVENVLNPATPLALRVSGHLMLGIVRIYSKKVKYLMNDVTEAMWKMKLAFRPGAVDLPEGQITGTIDDNRFFGNVSMDPDFPELMDAPFPGVQKFRMEEDVIEDVEFQNDWSRPVTSISGRISDVEIARRDQIRLSTSLLARTSVASSLQRTRDSSIHPKMDEDIPAFEEQEEMLFGTPAIERDIGRPMDEFVPMEMEEPVPFEMEPTPTFEEKALVEETREKKRRKVKKAAAVVDERVEISGRFIKNLMNDRSSMLRRDPQAPLADRHVDYVVDMGPSMTGLCRDLADTLNMTMSTTGFPFRSKYVAPSLEAHYTPEIETARRAPSEIAMVPEEYPEEYPSFHEAQLEPSQYEQPNFVEEEEFRPFPSEERKTYHEPTPKKYESVGKDNWNQRTKQILGLLQDKFATDKSASFEEMTDGISKRAAALSFFEILQLKTWNYIDVEQSTPFGDIKLYPGEACWA